MFNYIFYEKPSYTPSWHFYPFLFCFNLIIDFICGVIKNITVSSSDASPLNPIFQKQLQYKTPSMVRAGRKRPEASVFLNQASLFGATAQEINMRWHKPHYEG